MKDIQPVVIQKGRILNGALRVAEFKDLLIKDGVICEVSEPGLTVASEVKVIDASNMLLIPGLVNAHTHGHGSFSKGLGDRWTLEHLLHAGGWLNGSRRREDKYLSAALNAVEMVLKGCTATYDLYFEAPLPTTEGIQVVASAYEDVGVRSTIAPMIADRSFYQAIPGLFEMFPSNERERLTNFFESPAKQILFTCGELAKKWSFNKAQTRFALAPTIPLHCSDEFLISCYEIALQNDIGLHMHLAESRVQAVTGIQKYGKSLTAHLDDLGFLGPNFTAAHGVWLDDEDLTRLADNGCSLAHNPGSNLRLGSGIAPARKAVDLGLNVGIGTDGSHCADNQNMFEAMRIASFASRIRSPDTSQWFETTDIIHMATEGSAHALGFGDKIGRLSKGSFADIVFLDLSNVNFIPFNDPINQIVHTEDSSAVNSVMVNGEFVLKDREFVTINYTKLCHDVEEAVSRLLESNADSRVMAEKLEGMVSQFCVGLSRTPYHVNRWSAD
ncbi:MAG: amidohydrolase [Magnetovibrio sp.]|nr:amidohydrolase [Magnetovibrio sp.]